MRGYVYVISNKAMLGLVKVGFSTKDPRGRANELGTASPYPYIIEYEVLVDDPKKIEQEAHYILSHLNEGKEWFKCDALTALMAIRKASKGQKIYLENILNKECDSQLKNKDDNSKKSSITETLHLIDNLSKNRDKETAEKLSKAIGVKIVDNSENNLIELNRTDKDSQYDIAQRYLTGNGVRKSLKDAFSYFLSAAKQGHTLAQLATGLSLKNGRGVEKNYDEAILFLQEAAEKGNAEAQFYFAELVYLLLPDAPLCKIKNKSPEDIYLEFMTLSANQEYAPAILALGMNCSIKNNNEAAFSFYKRSAEKNHPLAQRHLADCYLNGNGCKRDLSRAKYWYELASNGKDKIAKDRLANWDSFI